MKTLIVLVRNPDASEWYIKYAINLARDLHLSVHLMYVAPSVSPPLSGPDPSGAALVRMQQNLEKRVTLARETMTSQVNDLMHNIAGKMIVDVTSTIGNEISLVNNMYAEHKAHMVMVASEGDGNSGFKSARVDEISQNVECPVWIVPEHTPYRTIDSIVYATDYQEEDISTLKNVIDLTRFVSPEITALHITETPDFELRIRNAGFQKVLQNKTGYDDLSVKALVEKNGANVPGMIVDYADKEDTDLLVLLKENKAFFERIFTSSTSQKIIQDSGYPVLVYHTES